MVSEEKTATVLKAIKLCRVTHEKLEIFYINNDSEFLNENLKTYREKSRMHHIQDLPYNPKSQGAVEVSSRTIHKISIPS